MSHLSENLAAHRPELVADWNIGARYEATGTRQASQVTPAVALVATEVCSLLGQLWTDGRLLGGKL